MAPLGYGIERSAKTATEKEKRKQEAVAQKAYEEAIVSDDATEEEVIEKPVKERKTFLDKLTERVKDFLDNAE